MSPYSRSWVVRPFLPALALAMLFFSVTTFTARDDVAHAAFVPATPGPLLGTLLSPTKIRLNWSDNSRDEKGFLVERCSSAGCTSFPTTYTVGVDATTFDNTVAPGLTYSYRVRAFNIAGFSSPSNVVTVAVPATPPSELQAKIATATSASLTWKDNTSNETSFEIERSTDGAAFERIASRGPQPGTGDTVGYTDPSLLLEHYYRYRVRALSAGGPSNYTYSSGVVSTFPPASPSDLSFEAGTPLPNVSITLRWSDRSNNETGFVVERSMDGLPFLPLGSTSGTTYKDDGLIAGPRYTYRVKAVLGPLSSGYTNEASLLAKQIPSAPYDLEVASSTPYPNASVSLRWKSSGIVGTFYVERSEDGGATFSLLGTRAPDQPTWVDSGQNLEVNHLYIYRVRAVNAGIPSLYSNRRSHTVKWYVPASPSFVHVNQLYLRPLADPDTSYESFANLQFTDVDGETGYEVQVDRVSTFDSLERESFFRTTPWDPRVNDLASMTPRMPFTQGPLFFRVRTLGPGDPSPWRNADNNPVPLQPFPTDQPI